MCVWYIYIFFTGFQQWNSSCSTPFWCPWPCNWRPLDLGKPVKTCISCKQAFLYKCVWRYIFFLGFQPWSTSFIVQQKMAWLLAFSSCSRTFAIILCTKERNTLYYGQKKWIHQMLSDTVTWKPGRGLGTSKSGLGHTKDRFEWGVHMINRNLLKHLKLIQ